MLAFVVRRLIGAIAVLIAVSFIVFLIFIVVPGGDPATRIAGKNANDQLTERKFTKPHREATARLYESFHEQLVAGIAAGRNLESAQVRHLIDGGPFLGIEPNGRRIDLRGVDVMQIEDGLISRNTVYYDGAAFARAVGMLPSQDSPAERAMFTAFNATTKLRRAIRERTQGSVA